MSGEGKTPKGGERGEPASPLPWPKDPPPGWPDRLPWPPMVAPGARGQKLCVEACMKAGGSLEACAIICAILDALPPLPWPPKPSPNGTLPQGGGGVHGVHDAIHAIDDDIIEELKEANRHRQHALDEARNAAANYAQGNTQIGDAMMRSADRENARAREIEIEVRGKERAKSKAQLFK